jgi:hypothetical protein
MFEAKEVGVVFNCSRCSLFQEQDLKTMVVGHRVNYDGDGEILDVILEFGCIFCNCPNTIKVFPLF